jgi:hypothetical protein
MEMDDNTFKNVGLWIGGIVAAIIVEAILARLAQRCMPGLFQNQQQPQQPQQQQQQRNRR